MCGLISIMQLTFSIICSVYTFIWLHLNDALNGTRMNLLLTQTQSANDLTIRVHLIYDLIWYRIILIATVLSESVERMIYCSRCL